MGDNFWAGTDGWISNDTTSGAQGILQDFVAELPLGKTAYLGFERPSSAFTTVARPVNYDPASGGTSRVEFESFLGVQDSTNGRTDRFFISFYDIGGDFLAAIVFDNTSAGADTLRGQGMADGSVQSTPTGVPFARGDQTLGFVAIQILYTQIDLEHNTWSAQLDGVPLFTDAPFADPALGPLTLGSVAAEWELDALSPFFAGDNWLFVADWFVRTVPKESPRSPSIQSREIRRVASRSHGRPRRASTTRSSTPPISSTGAVTSRALSYAGISTNGPLTFVDPQAGPAKRFYRIRRTAAP